MASPSPLTVLSTGTAAGGGQGWVGGGCSQQEQPCQEPGAGATSADAGASAQVGQRGLLPVSWRGFRAGIRSLSEGHPTLNYGGEVGDASPTRLGFPAPFQVAWLVPQELTTLPVQVARL